MTLLTHPFLSDQENLRAFLQLSAVPTGSVRKWEQILGWKPGRMQRFLKNAVKYGLAQVETCPQHTIFRPLETVADRSGSMCSVVPPNQEQGSGLTASRLQRPAVEKCNSPGGERLIGVMNHGLRHFNSYLPVSADNYGSHRAAQRWVQELGIPTDQAVSILHRIVSGFNLEKSGGEYPRSLGYFTKAVTAEWRRVQRDRLQLPLIPDIRLEREVA